MAGRVGKWRSIIGSNKLKKFLPLLLIVVIAGFWLWVLLATGLFRLHSANAGNRERLASLGDRLKLGDSYEDVLKKFWQVEGYQLRLKADTEKCWEVAMPLEILETDWRLLIGFEEDRVSAIKFRTSVGPKAEGSPEDIGHAPNCGY